MTDMMATTDIAATAMPRVFEDIAGSSAGAIVVVVV
jgi:hypothetical protein